MNALSVAHTLRLSSLEGVDVYFNTDRTIVDSKLNSAITPSKCDKFATYRWE